MFYGLYGSYRNAFLSEHRGPVLIDRMRELDYRFAIHSSFPMTWPEFRKYTFVDIVDHVKDVWPESESAKNDPLVIDAMLAFIDDPERKDQPFFGFVQLDSSHAPYTFPEEFGKYQPYTKDAKLVRYIDVTQRAPEMRNRYFNAVLWESYQVGRFWKELEARGLLENTAVVITGDHGEEFNEHGFWTHSGGYTPEQVHVPLVLWWPGAEPAVITERTTHMDLPATFLEGALGVKNPASVYSQGHTLLSDHPREDYAVSCGWRDCGVVDDHGYVVFGLESHYAMNFDVLDPDYKTIDDPTEVMAARGDRMIEVMQRMGAFLK
jgi:membrane-anchored protein YejM (alkaline phosphatase superfamily)